MPPDPEPAAAAVTAAEQPTEAVADSMDDAANAVGDAAEEAAEAGLDGLANRLGALETELRGHLQHPHGHDVPAAVEVTETVATPVAAEAVEIEAPVPVVKPKKLHIIQRLPRGF